MRGKDLVKAENMRGAAILVPADASVVCFQITAASVNATLNGGGYVVQTLSLYPAVVTSSINPAAFSFFIGCVVTLSSG